MGIPLRVLIVEDSEDDAMLLVRQLERAGYAVAFERVATAATCECALVSKTWDVIIADYALPGFGGMEALAIYKQQQLDLPFIIVSGAIGEDIAVEAMKAGAHDYVMKGNPTRLLPAIQRELREAEVRRERKHAEQALQESEQYARRIIESSLDMIITVDNERRIVEFNRAAQETFGYTREQALGKHVSLLYADAQEGETVHQIVFEEGKVVREILNTRRNGDRFPSLLSASVMRDAAGQVIGVVGVSRDITERKHAEANLLYLSTHDALTGLYNRTYFEVELTRLERGRLFPVSILVVDVDQLKATNDNWGHFAGDEVLRRAAQVLKAAFRGEDVVARIGGDEFCVLLPRADAVAGGQALDRLKASLAAHNAEGYEISLAFSAGIATGDKQRSMLDILKEADDHMYHEKRSKRSNADTSVDG